MWFLQARCDLFFTIVNLSRTADTGHLPAQQGGFQPRPGFAAVPDKLELQSGHFYVTAHNFFPDWICVNQIGNEDGIVRTLAFTECHL